MSALPGLLVGHATDQALKSGVTVFLPEKPAIAAVHVAGGAPASRETDLLAPGNLVERVDAIVLSGGSAFGLSAADGVMAGSPGRAAASRSANPRADRAGREPLRPRQWRRQGAPTIGPAAQSGARPRRLRSGVGEPSERLRRRRHGRHHRRPEGRVRHGEAELPDGIRVELRRRQCAAARTIGSSPHFRAAAFERGGEFGGLGLPTPLPVDAAEIVVKGHARPQESTTLAVVAVDCELTRAEAKRLAIAAHDGIALAIYPAHTPFDGDTVFALATGEKPLHGRPRSLIALGATAAATLARAIARAVHAAEPMPGDRLPTWRAHYGA